MVTPPRRTPAAHTFESIRSHRKRGPAALRRLGDALADAEALAADGMNLACPSQSCWKRELAHVTDVPLAARVAAFLSVTASLGESLRCSRAFPGRAFLPQSSPSLFARSLTFPCQGAPVPDVSWVVKEGAEGSVPEESGMQARRGGQILGIAADA